MGGSRNYKNKNKKSQSQSESMMGKKNHFFFVFPVLGPTLADEDTNRGLHAGALLPFSYKRGEGAFQVKQWNRTVTVPFSAVDHFLYDLHIYKNMKSDVEVTEVSYHTVL